MEIQYDKINLFFEGNYLTPIESAFLFIIKECKDIGISAIETQALFGFEHFIQANKLISLIGKKYLSFANISLPDNMHLYEIVSDPEKNYRDTSGAFKWVLRKQLSEYITLAKYEAQNSAIAYYYTEGRKTKILNTHYERSYSARMKCIEHYGCACIICGFDFHATYGSIGKDYIEVHHSAPIHDKQGPYVINPATDLIPVCANCHSILHRRNPPFTKDEVIAFLQTTKESP